MTTPQHPSRDLTWDMGIGSHEAMSHIADVLDGRFAVSTSLVDKIAFDWSLAPFIVAMAAGAVAAGTSFYAL